MWYKQRHLYGRQNRAHAQIEHTVVCVFLGMWPCKALFSQAFCVRALLWAAGDGVHNSPMGHST